MQQPFQITQIINPIIPTFENVALKNNPKGIYMKSNTIYS